MRWLRKYMSDNIGNNITENISLPAEGPKGSKITWTSSHEGYISNTGIEDSSKYVGVKNLDGLSEGVNVALNDSGREIDGYKSYYTGNSKWYQDTCQNIMYDNLGKKRVITANPGDRVWLFGGNRPKCKLEVGGYPFFLIMDCTVTGSAKIQSLYFKDETKVLNIANQLVGSLNDGKIYTSNSNRDYNGDDGELN